MTAPTMTRFTSFVLFGVSIALIGCASSSNRGAKNVNETPAAGKRVPCEGDKCIDLEFVIDYESDLSLIAYREVYNTQVKYPGKLKVRITHFPDMENERSRNAAIAAECARKQNKFDEMNAALFGLPDVELREPPQKVERTIAEIERMAQAKNLDLLTFGNCQKEDITSFANISSDEGKFDSELPPALLINGKNYTLPIQVAELSKTIDDLLAGKSMSEVGLKLAGDKTRSYYGCYYYDANEPYASVVKNPSWDWAFRWTDDGWWGYLRNYEYIQLDGTVQDGFFMVDEKSGMTPQKIDELCADVLKYYGNENRLLNVGAFNSAIEPYDRRIGVPSTIPKSFKFDRIVLFGDSLSDIGNLQKWLRYMPTRPYFMGRFSNGRVWIEYLSKFLKEIPVDNWAYGGAKSSAINIGDNVVSQFVAASRNNVTGSVAGTIDKYFSTHEATPETMSPALFVIWGGANNYLEKTEASPFAISGSAVSGEIPIVTFDDHLRDQKAATDYAQVTINDISDSVTRLYARGARKFLVLPLPDMGKTPAASDLKANVAMTYLAKIHNEKLNEAMAKLRLEKSDIVIVVPDIEAELTRIVSEPKYEIANTTESCFKGSYFLGDHFGGSVCPDPNKYLYFDTVHPTSKMHCLLSSFLLRSINKAGLTDMTKAELDQSEDVCTSNRFRAFY